uniref:F-box protein 16 n=1 Tax=Serinus canaria TaxID=9135 RepID=A0A8C9NLI8_SERCA
WKNLPDSAFDKWTDGQRRRILVDLLERCSLSQQKFCAEQLQARVPTEAVDFTTRLPRVLSLYIFSFLDPRSLCRCAQVSWHWKYLSELDQLWMLKCLRFGWLLNFCPTPLEQGVWKKHYIEMVRELRLTRPKTPSKDEFIVIDVQPVKSNVPERKLSVAGLGTSRGKKDLPPWRSSDRNPTDTVRYNYLDNHDPIDKEGFASLGTKKYCIGEVKDFYLKRVRKFFCGALICLQRPRRVFLSGPACTVLLEGICCLCCCFRAKAAASRLKTGPCSFSRQQLGQNATSFPPPLPWANLWPRAGSKKQLHIVLECLPDEKIIALGNCCAGSRPRF